MRRALVAAVLALLLGGCSSSLDVRRTAAGQCVQERREKFVGITYDRTQSLVRCPQ